MYKNNIFLDTIQGDSCSRPPVWLMRQAGRILPQYRALRAGLSGFKELVETPELACEVTIQPIDELEVDAAIIFSDILVIPDAMGLKYEMIPGKGPLFPSTITSSGDIEKLISGSSAADDLNYVYEALALTKKTLNNRVPLIGFAGAPFTIFCYMIEGQGSKTFSKAKKMLYQSPELAHSLLNKITDTTIAYLQNKTNHGADVIQIFDSWAGVLDQSSFLTFSLPYIQKIIDALNVPTTIFAKGAWHSIKEMAESSCNVVGLGWTDDPERVRQLVGKDKILQGNLDPCALYSDPKTIESKTKKMISKFGGNHIVNLGHGVYPDTPLENVRVFVETVKAYNY